jgi:hypothetical protein
VIDESNFGSPDLADASGSSWLVALDLKVATTRSVEALARNGPMSP